MESWAHACIALAPPYPLLVFLHQAPHADNENFTNQRRYTRAVLVDWLCSLHFEDHSRFQLSIQSSHPHTFICMHTMQGASGRVRRGAPAFNIRSGGRSRLTALLSSEKERRRNAINAVRKYIKNMFPHALFGNKERVRLLGSYPFPDLCIKQILRCHSSRVL